MKFTLIFSIAILFSISSTGQSDLALKLDSLLATETGNHTPGCAIAVLKNGKTIFNRGYGMANVENGVAFTPTTVSDIGSVAKQFTAYAIVLLEAQGKLSFDDNIGKHLPYTPDLGHEIKIKNLIHHTSGIREVYSILSVLGGRSGDGIQQKDARMVLENSRELNFAPGEKYMYCNTAYMLLADIVSVVSGMPFEDWMKANIFAPLGMTNTFIMDKHGEVFPKCASSYRKLEDGSYSLVFDNSTGYGQGGIYSNMPDMVKWMNNYADPKVGNDQAIRQMYQLGVLNNGDTQEYAFGLRLADYRGLKVIGHNGASAGYRTAFDFFPDHDLGVIIKTNVPTIDLGGILDLVLETLLKSELVDEESEKEEPEDEKKEPYQLEGPAMGEYVGQYFCPEFHATYFIEIINGELVLIHRKHSEIMMHAESKDEFATRGFGGTRIAFERNENGISGLRMTSGRMTNLWFEKR